jgi:DNA segregation ATPase FtsK/SpoIIIE-like protein
MKNQDIIDELQNFKEQISQYDEKLDGLLDRLMIDDTVEFIKTRDDISTDSLQVKFKIGYSRAARLIDLLIEKGLVVKKDEESDEDGYMEYIVVK